MNQIVEQLLNHLQDQSPLVLGTILETRGSSPQVPGASAVMSATGLLAGTLGGGIMEADALRQAAEAIQEGSSRIYDFDLDSDVAAGEGAICGGTAKLLLSLCSREETGAFRELVESIARGLPGVLLTRITRGPEQALAVRRSWIPKERTAQNDSSGFGEEIKQCFRGNRTSLLAYETSWLMIQPVFPLTRLVIAGAGHIGRAVARLGKLLDFEVTVIDDREEFCNPVLIPEADHLIVDDVGKALGQDPLTPSTFVVIVTRGHQDDARALKACIGSGAAYTGMIGSRNKIRTMKQQFLEQGWAKRGQLDRIYAPIGLEIGSKTIQEIAISIAAQLVQVRSAGSSRRHSSTAAIVLAAGESKRMGEPKMIMPYGTSTIIGTLIGEAERSAAGKIIVVVGAHREQVLDKIGEGRVELINNKEYRRGMFSSFRKGLEAVPESCQAVMVLLGDQPMITAGVMDALISAYANTGKGIVIANHRGKRGHPVLIDMKYRQELEEMDLSRTLKDFISAHQKDVLDEEVDSPAVLTDIDTKEDYQKITENRRY